jgi:ABC-type transport system substrate-binding protein
MKQSQQLPYHLQQSLFLSRRAFLRTMALAGGATAASMVLAGCPAPGASTGGSAAPAAQNAATGPKIGGTYRLLGRGDIRSLDPPAAESSEDWWSAGMVLYNQLYFYTKDGEFYADLAADLPKISSSRSRLRRDKLSTDARMG